MASLEKKNLESALNKIRVPQTIITAIIKNFELLAKDISAGRLARGKAISPTVDPLKEVAQKLVADPSFRNKFITDYQGAVKPLGYYTPDQKVLE